MREYADRGDAFRDWLCSHQSLPPGPACGTMNFSLGLSSSGFAFLASLCSVVELLGGDCGDGRLRRVIFLVVACLVLAI